MNEAEKNRLAGFRLIRIYVGRQSYALAEGGEELPEGDTDEREFAVAWDWRLSDDDPNEFSIAIGITVQPNAEAPERVEARVVGDFLSSGVTSVSLESFVKGNGPAILFPYVRQLITQLTSSGPIGAFYLPAVNMLEVLKTYEFSESTGAKQLSRQLLSNSEGPLLTLNGEAGT